MLNTQQSKNVQWKKSVMIQFSLDYSLINKLILNCLAQRRTEQLLSAFEPGGGEGRGGFFLPLGSYPIYDQDLRFSLPSL